MFKRAIFLGALCAAGMAAAPVSASPATGFLSAVREALAGGYYPKPGVDVGVIMDRAREDLDRECAALAGDCPLETGVEAARRAVAALDDTHTRIDRAPPPLLGAQAHRGPTAASTPLGWMVRAVRGSDRLYVAWVDPDGPAARAGVQRYDLILAAPDMSAARLGAFDGPATVTLSRGGRTFEVTLNPDSGRRGPLPRLDRVGEVAVLQVPTGAGNGVAQAAHDLLAGAIDAGVTGVVLDLRDNGGGGIECAAMASAFLDYEVVMTDGAGDRRVLTITPGAVRIAEGGGDETLSLDRSVRWTGPLAVLVNRNTGSCAEAVAIQASLAGRAAVIGEDSVGVGNNVIRPVPLPDGWRLLMTTAYNSTPDGELLPPRPPLDLEVTDDPVAISATGRDAVLEAAVAWLG
ncbi:S41 family peptidase [Brevundimonas basaltis]|uniref:Carboxyl-terminal processing protease n=1 Tax=Brevundimonas basaltis TaxID=472166 RepID=A0A7W8HX97_9CAUL|nr:S41 family peptidase [Brevundimonas basaltis]MBB5290642.1 carboxyl-terminal processing protease [Brevundimonas basaltis]